MKETHEEPQIFNILDSIQITDLPRDKKGCQHMRIRLDTTRRMIECQDCGCWIEAFDYLVQFGNRCFNLAARIGRERQEELRQICDEIESKKKELRNLKAAIRRGQA